MEIGCTRCDMAKSMYVNFNKALKERCCAVYSMVLDEAGTLSNFFFTMVFQ